MSDFWARRKEAVAREAETDAMASKALVAAQAETDLAERSDEELLAEANLAAPETLDSADAVREFMNSALPQRLKTRALRQLWKLNPVLANLDGLVDYGEDFTDSATVIENLQTAYQVGKGMLKHVEELARQKEAAARDDDEPNPDDDLDAVSALAEEEAHEDQPLAVDRSNDPAQVQPITYDDVSDEPVVALPARRMQFHFDTQEPA